MAGYIGSKASVTVTSPETDSRYVNVTGDTMTGDLTINGSLQLEEGTGNVGVGKQALSSNTASNNTAVGYQAGYSNTTGLANTYIGRQAGLSNTTSSYSTYLGYVAGESTTGEKNTFLGQGAGSSVTTGSKNTILGRYNGNQGGLDIRTSSNNIVLSDGDGNPRLHIDSTGYLATGPTANTSSFRSGTVGGTDSYRATTNTGFGVHHFLSDVGGTRTMKSYISGAGTLDSVSDYRIKENVTEITGGLSRIKALRPVSYNQIGSDRKEDGFIAHELQEVIPHLVTGEKDGLKEDGSMFIQAVNHQGLFATLVSAIQEQQIIIKELEARIAALETV